MSERETELAERIAELAKQQGWSVATAESLTSGAIASRLGAAAGAAEWFRGGLVCYHERVKHRVLGVDPGPVVTARAARQMAQGVSRLLESDVAVATSGAGGPDPQDDQPPGTVFVAVVRDGGDQVREFHFDGDPADVVARSTRAALELLLEELSDGTGRP